MKSTVIHTLLLLILSNILTYSQVSFEYSTKPGTEDWKLLQTESERTEALQIPDSILDKLSTKELVRACLNYPAFFLFAAYDDIQTGFHATSMKFNGINALMRRKDAGIELLSIYSQKGLNVFLNNELQLDDKYWPIRLSFMEILMSQQAIIGPMSLESQLKLLRACRNKIDLKLDSDINSIFAIQPTSLIMSRVMKIANLEDFKEQIDKNDNLKYFDQTGKLPDIKTLNDLVDQVDNILTKQ